MIPAMSRWARTSSQHQKHRQGSTGVLVAERSELSEDSEFASFLEDVLNFCDAENLQMEAENTDDLIEELEVWARVPALDEDTRDQLRGFIEMAKKMVFKMLDKTKKTVTVDDDEEMEEGAIGSPGNMGSVGSMLGGKRPPWMSKPEKPVHWRQWRKPKGEALEEAKDHRAWSDPMKWMIKNYLKFDVHFGPTYFPGAGVLRQREEGRQRDEIKAIGKKMFGDQFAAEWAGKGMWVTHRDNRDKFNHAKQQRRLADAMKNAGYKPKVKDYHGQLSITVPFQKARLNKIVKINDEYEALIRKKRGIKEGSVRGLARELREEPLQERQKSLPTMGDPDEKKGRKGAFKVSSKILKLWKSEVGASGPDWLLFKQVRDRIAGIPRNDLPKIWGKSNIADAQDMISGRPKKAFQMWLRNVKKVDPKMQGYIQRVADNVPLVYYGFMVRVVGNEMADIIFKRYFETEAGHPGELKRKKKKDDSSAQLAKRVKKQGIKMQGIKEGSLRSLANELRELVNIFHAGPKSRGVSDADNLCRMIMNMVGSATRGRLFHCELDSRFGGGTVFVDYASVGEHTTGVKALNAKIKMHWSIGPFGEDGSSKGKVKAKVMTQRGIKGRAKTGTLEQVAKHVARWIKKAADEGFDD